MVGEPTASGRERHYAVEPGPLREAAARVKAPDETLPRGIDELGKHLHEKRSDESR